MVTLAVAYVDVIDGVQPDKTSLRRQVTQCPMSKRKWKIGSRAWLHM